MMMIMTITFIYSWVTMVNLLTGTYSMESVTLVNIYVSFYYNTVILQSVFNHFYVVSHKSEYYHSNSHERQVFAECHLPAVFL